MTTDWLPITVRPVHVGWYEVRFWIPRERRYSGAVPRYWNGKIWNESAGRTLRICTAEMDQWRGGGEMSIEQLTWHATADESPDDESTVLIRSPRLDPPVWLGYLSAGQWWSVDAEPVRDVTHWAQMPEGPAT